MILILLRNQDQNLNKRRIINNHINKDIVINNQETTHSHLMKHLLIQDLLMIQHFREIWESFLLQTIHLNLKNRILNKINSNNKSIKLNKTNYKDQNKIQDFKKTFNSFLEQMDHKKMDSNIHIKFQECLRSYHSLTNQQSE